MYKKSALNFKGIFKTFSKLESKGLCAKSRLLATTNI